MKPLNLKSQTKAAKSAKPTFNPSTLQRIQDALAPLIDADGLRELNATLTQGKRRTLALVDFARIAYVHARSISENEGYSPYVRIRSFCKANGHEYDNLHIRLVTSALVEMEFMHQIAEEDIKHHQCRKYQLSEDAKTIISPFPHLSI